jgi:hypothetical protein
MPITIDGTNGITQAGEFNSSGSFGFKNRIINGAMVIDQRNAGASVTPTADGTYTLDRWKLAISQASKLAFQQNAGSVTPPTGFTKYLGATSQSAYSVGSSDYFAVYQAIEGFNAADLNWGTASAQSVTLSFWVRSSLTGTFSGSLFNPSGSTQSYVFNYTVSSANTWEYKTISIAGVTTGTWDTTNGTFSQVRFGLGTGTTYSTGTTGSWITGNYVQSTGSTSVVGTNGATFYITGVQLEVSSTATSFDYRSIGAELALCQRYYQTYPAVGQGSKALWSGQGTTVNYVAWIFKTTMRTSPTIAGSTLGTLDTSSPDLVQAYSGGGNYASFGWNGSSYSPATATAEL